MNSFTLLEWMPPAAPVVVASGRIHQQLMASYTSSLRPPTLVAEGLLHPATCSSSGVSICTLVLVKHVLLYQQSKFTCFNPLASSEFFKLAISAFDLSDSVAMYASYCFSPSTERADVEGSTHVPHSPERERDQHTSTYVSIRQQTHR